MGDEDSYFILVLQRENELESIRDVLQESQKEMVTAQQQSQQCEEERSYQRAELNKRQLLLQDCEVARDSLETELSYIRGERERLQAERQQVNGSIITN